jgi:lipopolysaccharide/colanic/teichoic acid biosynthesis glycosyltransferase
MEQHALLKKELRDELRIAREDYFHNAEETVKTFIDESQKGVFAKDLFWINSTVTVPELSADSSYAGLAIFNRINDTRRINKYLEELNRNLKTGSYLLINLETKNARRARLLNRFPRILSKPVYVIDFFINRVLPKFKLTRKLFFSVTKGRNRVLTLTEALGRLKSCGFKTLATHRFGYRTYILAQKEGDPVYDMEPTYGALVKMRRVGYNGNIIGLYKLRTMHPYSEYLQEFIYEQNGTSNGDKINDDFRVTNWGKIFRKFWIDELPMLWNWLKRDLKLVGVRPLSEHKFYTYPEALQKKRIQVKPGLVPPFYADLPETPEEFFECEERYLDAYMKKPIRTDIRYFFKAMYNIFVKRARSA